MKAPLFWRKGGNRVARAMLWPLSLAWQAGTALRRATVTPSTVDVPVICIGNLELGGTGKTPTVQLLSAWFASHGIQAGVLSRGYGGSLSGKKPVLVDPDCHGASDVGDEPLLHARAGPVVISPDRAAGARLLSAHCDVILMDDGHQNPGLVKDLSLVVTPASEAFGNGDVFPAGPLRESIAAGLGRANAIVAIGDGITDQRLTYSGLPVIRARLQTSINLEGRNVLGFCGIGRPEGFRLTLERQGAKLAGFQPFPDHHPFSDQELLQLEETANSLGAQLITTEKDAVRLPSSMRERVLSVPVKLTLDQPETLDGLLGPILARVRKPAFDATQTSTS